jgi:hypothetical protein
LPLLPHVSLAIVTGAPGSGKSSAVRTLLARQVDFLVFDADWLLDAASALSGRQVVSEGDLWPPYRIVWLVFLRMIAANHRQAVLFMPLEPSELPRSWRGSVRWCLLDCDAATRRARLRARGWQAAAIDEAIADGTALRQQIPRAIDTGRREPESVAVSIVDWLARLSDLSG